MEEIEIKGLDETIYTDKTLYNMPVYIWQNNNLNGFYLSLCVNYGSLHTDFNYNGKKYHVPNGSAHFMEHIKFNEKKDFKANSYFDKLGSDINAFTTFEYTNYEVFAVDHLEENLSHLVKYVLTPYFTNKIINNEKGIITEEIKMDMDDPFASLFYRSLGNIFKNSHYRYKVAGEVCDIKNIKLADIKLIYEAFYHPENMFLVVSGNVNRYEVMKVVNDTLKKLKISSYNMPNILKEKEPLKVLKREDVYYDNVYYPKAKLCYKIPLKIFKGMKKVEILLYSYLILSSNFGVTSTFKEHLLENSMILDFNFSRSIMDDYLIIAFTYESRVYESVTKLVLQKMSNLDFSENDIKRSIKSNIASLVTKYESIEDVSSDIQNNIISYGMVCNNLKELLTNVSMDEIKNIIKYLKTDNYSFTCVLPCLNSEQAASL